MNPPDKAAANGGRDPTTGRFLPGNSGGPGRPPGIDLRRLAEQQAAEHGVSLEQGLWAVVQALLTAAQQGDVGAARLLFDKLCTPETLAMAGVALTVVSRVPREEGQ